MVPTVKEFRYAVVQDRAGRISADGESELELATAWTPEHLVLAGLVRCSITSLRYHALRAGITVHASGTARGLVTKRESDGRYAFVDVSCSIGIALDPPLEGAELDALLAKAERDCFVGASLTVRPSYEWRTSA